MSVKLTKKQLKETGIIENAFYLGGNVYNYENAIYYLGTRDLENVQKNVKGYDIEPLINYFKNYNMEQINIIATQIFYSASTYGNSGQLHKLTIIDKKTDKKLDTIYVYYC